MTTIEDLPQQSISEMSTDEALDLLRQIRLSRRIPKTSSKKRAKTKAKKTTPLAKLNMTQAQKLLELLEGG